MVTVAPAPRHSATAGRDAEHHRWALLTYALLLVGAFVAFGVDSTLGVIAGALNVIFLAYFFRHLAFAISAARWAEEDLVAADVGVEAYAPPLAVLVACKNEELVVDGMISALLGLDYPRDALSLVVVDDGSTDGTAARLDAWAAAEPRLRVLHRAPDAGGGKSGALNDALAQIQAEIVVVFDADHEPERNVLRRLVRHFRDPNVGAVMGRCVVRNGVESSLASTIFIDYLSGYLVNEYGRQALFELPAYGGANCAVRTDVLRALNGWNPHTVTEDTDLTLRVLLGGRRVRYDPAAVDFEEAVLSSGRFWRQRYRWARGHQKCLRDYWRTALRSPHLRLAEKIETLMFLWVYHIPVLCGLGLLITALRGFGIGGPAAIDILPLSTLLFAGPFAELSVGLLLGRVERRAAWLLVGFIPAFGLSILTATAAYFDGMWGRRYSWAKTARSGATSVRPAAPAPVGPAPVSFARRALPAGVPKGESR
ncbi:Glycosyltransferase, catalytic subunit of cellulose synthase and poly-beta-1,6-N-acetylglucosamine synthase [Micromonospora pattaloongensis]|uniref:Glycosyltransferase, catalytic subunit of cellulose synthase and poly-beta-1,6-N-acetylglucosamine synthase n=1 Tax=Micromonospora pattaloongensis TaxID=405436 RepID=A0A1H3LXS4_9ACTN|nr:glycosyltransferase [Micromonospora pattaloongensis]SDY68615.1 Glycosyltransferase, catalytic subunit of cellulose synthase and poly-beta-1,6-N-acetylglucosamine synthase [Micromonospora pattaloongensis]